MSYEGYSQFICKAGHYFTRDCWEVGWDNKVKCNCGEPIIWENMVDITNGSYDEEGNQIDGYEEPRPISRKKCEGCNTTLEILFAPPSKVDTMETTILSNAIKKMILEARLKELEDYFILYDNTGSVARERVENLKKEIKILNQEDK